MGHFWHEKGSYFQNDYFYSETLGNDLMHGEKKISDFFVSWVLFGQDSKIRKLVIPEKKI